MGYQGVPHTETAAGNMPDYAASRKGEGARVTCKARKEALARGPQMLVHKMVTRGRLNSEIVTP